MTSINFKICTKNCKNLVFTETTGAYSPSNTSGWGTPNEATSDAVTATLAIYNSNNDLIATLDMLAGLVNPDNTSQTHTFPNDSYSETSYNFYQGLISNTSLGYLPTEIIPDGVYTFVYTVTTAENTYTKTKYAYHFCTVGCCVDKAFAKVPDTSCDCDGTAYTKAIKMKTLYEALKKAAECFQKERFERLLRILQNICTNNKCDCN